MSVIPEGTIQHVDDDGLKALATELRAATQNGRAGERWPAPQLSSCGERGVFRWFLPEEYGGLAWTAAETVEGFLELSAACLTTTFVLTQLTGACRRIASGDNAQIKAALLPKLAAGETLTTLGISHLTTSRRHLAEPALCATALDLNDDFALHGFSPWVTGAAHVDAVLTGAELPDGRQFLAHVPLTTEGVTVEQPAELVALSGSETGKVNFNNVHVPRDWLLGEPIEAVMQTGIGAGTGGLQTSTLALGLSTAAIEYVRAESVKRPDLTGAADQLQTELDENIAALRALAEGQGHDSGCSPAELRVKSNSLVLRATQAALVAAKGAGYVSGHPAGRWCQEALFFLVWSCPQPVSNANLCEFARID